MGSIGARKRTTAGAGLPQPAAQTTRGGDIGLLSDPMSRVNKMEHEMMINNINLYDYMTDEEKEIYNEHHNTYFSGVSEDIDRKATDIVAGLYERYQKGELKPNALMQEAEAENERLAREARPKEWARLDRQREQAAKRRRK